MKDVHHLSIMRIPLKRETDWVSCYLWHFWSSMYKLSLTSKPPSLCSSSSLWLTLGSEAGVGSFLHWVTGLRTDSIHPRTRDDDQAPHRRTSLLSKWTLQPFLLTSICNLLPNSVPFVFYECGEIVGGKRIPLTVTKKEGESKRRVLVVREIKWEQW